MSANLSGYVYRYRAGFGATFSKKFCTLRGFSLCVYKDENNQTYPSKMIDLRVAVVTKESGPNDPTPYGMLLKEPGAGKKGELRVAFETTEMLNEWYDAIKKQQGDGGKAVSGRGEGDFSNWVENYGGPAETGPSSSNAPEATAAEETATLEVLAADDGTGDIDYGAAAADGPKVSKKMKQMVKAVKGPSHGWVDSDDDDGAGSDDIARAPPVPDAPSGKKDKGKSPANSRPVSTASMSLGSEGAPDDAGDFDLPPEFLPVEFVEMPPEESLAVPGMANYTRAGWADFDPVEDLYDGAANSSPGADGGVAFVLDSDDDGNIGGGSGGMQYSDDDSFGSAQGPLVRGSALSRSSNRPVSRGGVRHRKRPSGGLDSSDSGSGSDDGGRSKTPFLPRRDVFPMNERLDDEIEPVSASNIALEEGEGGFATQAPGSRSSQLMGRTGSNALRGGVDSSDDESESRRRGPLREDSRVSLPAATGAKKGTGSRRQKSSRARAIPQIPDIPDDDAPPPLPDAPQPDLVSVASKATASSAVPAEPAPPTPASPKGPRRGSIYEINKSRYVAKVGDVPAAPDKLRGRSASKKATTVPAVPDVVDVPEPPSTPASAAEAEGAAFTESMAASIIQTKYRKHLLVQLESKVLQENPKLLDMDEADYNKLLAAIREEYMAHPTQNTKKLLVLARANVKDAAAAATAAKLASAPSAPASAPKASSSKSGTRSRTRSGSGVAGELEMVRPKKEKKDKKSKSRVPDTPQAKILDLATAPSPPSAVPGGATAAATAAAAAKTTAPSTPAAPAGAAAASSSSKAATKAARKEEKRARKEEKSRTRSGSRHKSKHKNAGVKDANDLAAEAEKKALRAKEKARKKAKKANAVLYGMPHNPAAPLALPPGLYYAYGFPRVRRLYAHPYNRQAPQLPHWYYGTPTTATTGRSLVRSAPNKFHFGNPAQPPHARA